MINLIVSIFTIVKLLYKGDIKISYNNLGRLDIIFKGNAKTLRIITDKLVMDYNVAYFGSTELETQHDNSKEEVKNLTISKEDLELLNKLDKELNVPCC